MIRLFGLDSLSLRALQKHYYLRYGTTLRGLMTEHGVDAEPICIMCTTSTARRLSPITLSPRLSPLCRGESSSSPMARATMR